MTITRTNLTQGGGSFSGSAVSTASVSPGASQLVLISVAARYANTPTGTLFTVAGNGLTWHQHAVVNWIPTGTSSRSMATFYSMGASPSSGAITVTATNGGGAAVAATWCVTEFSGVITTGADGADALGVATTAARIGAAPMNCASDGGSPGANGEIRYVAFSTEDGGTTPTINNGSWTKVQDSLVGTETWTVVGTNITIPIDADTAQATAYNSDCGGIAFRIYQAAASTFVPRMTTMGCG